MIRVLLDLLLLVALILNMPEICSYVITAPAAIVVRPLLMVTEAVRICPIYRLRDADTCGA